MKITALTALLLFVIVGCGSKPVDQEPVYKNVVICTHKYSSDYSFVYRGQIKTYQKIMFGEKVFVYEYTLIDGAKLFLSGNDVVNFVCVKQIR